MQSKHDGSTETAAGADGGEASRGGPPNAFERTFLSALARRGEVSTGTEAEMHGPWKVCPLPRQRFGVFRGWEDPGERGPGTIGEDELGPSGDVPELVFENREHALLAAAVLPATGREPLFQLSSKESPEGFAIQSVWGEQWVSTVGRLRFFHPDVIQALHVAESVARSPAALAQLLEAAGPTALELAGRILHRKLQEASND